MDLAAVRGANDLLRHPCRPAADRAEWPGGDSLVEAVVAAAEEQSRPAELHSRAVVPLGSLDTHNLHKEERHTTEVKL